MKPKTVNCNNAKYENRFFAVKIETNVVKSRVTKCVVRAYPVTYRHEFSVDTFELGQPHIHTLPLSFTNSYYIFSFYSIPLMTQCDPLKY